MTRAKQNEYAHMIALEHAVWDARKQELVTRNKTHIPMTADEAIVLYGMALRHATGRVPIFSQ